MSETLDTCVCCEGIETATPVSVKNRPGLSALAYRVGTHGRFKQSMQAALASQQALQDLATRADDDPSMALLDAWATTLDVLSFYQERIANEGYLRTASERRSVLELARRIGYELNPGVAASTYLAFSLQDAPGAPESANVLVGTQAQTIPGQDEVPQPFETVEEIAARVEWQAMAACQRRTQEIGFGTRSLYFEGVDNNLSVGDMLLFVGAEREADPENENWDMRRITEVEIDRGRELTFVELEYGLGSYIPFVRPAAEPKVYVMRRRAALFGHNAPDWNAMPIETRQRYDPDLSPDDPADGDSVLDDWPGLDIGAISGIGEEEFPDGPIYLDALYPKIVPKSWIVLAKPSDEDSSAYAELYRIDGVAEDAYSRFTISTKITRLEIDGENLSNKFNEHVRSVVVYGESEELAVAEEPIEEPVSGTIVELAEVVEGLVEGQLVAVTGTDVTGEPVAEVATIKAVDVQASQITFEKPLEYTYVREDGDDIDGVRFNANVARATHGKAVADEVLGSGDGSQVFQKFTLAQKPLTHVAAATASGVESTLEVRVDGVLWEEKPTLYQQSPNARVYITRLADDGTVTVQFGDGRSGVRLPTGVENVTADYRHRIGLEGMVVKEQISLLMTRPLGVKKVVNPTAPTGAGDPEELADARDNAPLTVLTLHRIVSIQDFEDFASAFAGVGKAQATVLWSGERRLVHLTVAGADGVEVPNDSALYENLLAAIDGARHVAEEVLVDTYAKRTFTIEARVLVDGAYIEDDVLAAAEAALLRAFSFDERALGQAVTSSEVLAVMQAVEGVVAVDLDKLDGADPFAFPRLPAAIARWSGGNVLPAELLTIDPDNITLSLMTT